MSEVIADKSDFKSALNKSSKQVDDFDELLLIPLEDPEDEYFDEFENFLQQFLASYAGSNDKRPIAMYKRGSTE